MITGTFSVSGVPLSQINVIWNEINRDLTRDQISLIHSQINLPDQPH